MTEYKFKAIYAYRGDDSPNVQANGEWKVSNKYTEAAAGTTPIAGFEIDTMKEGELAEVDCDTNLNCGSRLVRMNTRGIWDVSRGPGRMTLHYILGADTEDNGATEPAAPDFTVPWNNARAVDNSKVVYVNREAGSTPKQYTDTPAVDMDFGDLTDNPYKGGVYSNHGIQRDRTTFGWQGIEFIAEDSQVNITKPGWYLITLTTRFQDQATTDCDCEEVIIDNPVTGTVHLHLAGQTGGSSVTIGSGARYLTGRSASLVRAVDENEKLSLRLRTRVATALTAEATPNRHIMWNITRMGPVFTANGDLSAGSTLSGRLI